MYNKTQYYGSRLYDPVIYRVLQPDAVVADPSRTQSYHRYAYVMNNPLKYNDPTGWLPAVSNNHLPEVIPAADVEIFDSGYRYFTIDGVPVSSTHYAHITGEGMRLDNVESISAAGILAHAGYSSTGTFQKFYSASPIEASRRIGLDNALIQINKMNGGDLLMRGGRVHFTSTAFAVGPGASSVSFEGEGAWRALNLEGTALSLQENHFSASIGFDVGTELPIWTGGPVGYNSSDGASSVSDVPRGNLFVPVGVLTAARVVDIMSLMVSGAAKGIKAAAPVVRWAGRISTLGNVTLALNDYLAYNRSDRSWGDKGKLSVSLTASGLGILGKNAYLRIASLALGIANEQGAFDAVYEGLDTWNYIYNLNLGNKRLGIK